MDSPTLCFTCGQPVTTPPSLNELADGEPCPTCRERALDEVAPALPTRGQPQVVSEDDEAADSGSDEAPLFSMRPFGDDYPEPA